MIRVLQCIARLAIPKVCWGEFGVITLFWLVLVLSLGSYAFRQHRRRLQLEVEVVALKNELHRHMSDRERIDELSKRLDSWKP